MKFMWIALVGLLLSGCSSVSIYQDIYSDGGTKIIVSKGFFDFNPSIYEVRPDQFYQYNYNRKTGMISILILPRNAKEKGKNLTFLGEN